MRSSRRENPAAGNGQQDAGGNLSGGVQRVLGIDPGTVALGWGVVESRGATVTHVASGVIRAGGSRPARLETIYAELCVICTRYLPGALSLEQTFVGDNVQSAFRLGEARGAVMVAASQSRVAVAEYSPAEIKLAVAGNGRASKSQMQFMVGRLLNIAESLAADEADALGAAICHLYAGRFRALVADAPAWGASGRNRRTVRR